jgi:glycosyltransferase involved in cell wall biosynthesis
MRLEKFDVVIPTKNSSRTLDSCLNQLFQSDVPINKVIVVDKRSKDETVQIAEKHGCQVISSDANYSQALRIGAEKAQTEHILILDSDVLINQRFYSKLRGYLGRFFIVKGVHRHKLGWKQLSHWLFDLGLKEINALEAAFVHRDTFLELTESWENGHMDAGSDVWLYRVCKQLKIPVISLPEVVNIHLTGDFRHLFRHARWYGRSARKSKLESFATLIVMFLRSPLTGLRLVLQYRSLQLLPFYVTLRFYYLLGYAFG